MPSKLSTKAKRSVIDWDEFFLGILRLILLIIVLINLAFHAIYWSNYEFKLSNEYDRENHLVMAVFISFFLINIFLMILAFQDSIKTLIVCVTIASINQWFLKFVSLRHGLYQLLIGHHSFFVNMFTYACFIGFSIIRLWKLGHYNPQPIQRPITDQSSVSETTPTTTITS